MPPNTFLTDTTSVPARSDLLIAYGFTNKKGDFEGGNPQEIRSTIQKELKEKSGKEKKDYEESLHEAATHDEIEIAKNQVLLVDYPKPQNKFHLVYESPNTSIEPLYFWSLNLLKEELGFGWIEKITDVFAASEHSSFWGAASSRLGLSQQKVQEYLGLIGQFVHKDLFQMVRELRWIQERLDYHNKALAGKVDALIVLKGIWVDVVDGKLQGQQVTPNVIQMSQQINFTPLADFFFATHPKNMDSISDAVESLGTTKPLKIALKRKLHEFATWRIHNYKELTQRRSFTLKYLRQHYNVIKMYIQWLKPYILHVERLGTDKSKMSNADLISSFEGNMITLEILGAKIPEGNKNIYSCVVLTFDYRTRPQLSPSFSQEQPGYHKGPIHVGETRITWRSYAWTSEQIENFIKMKDREDLEMLKNIDKTIAATIESIGDELFTFLEEAEGLVNPQKEEEEEEDKNESLEERPPFWTPLTDISGGVKDIYRLFKPKKEKEGPSDDEKKTAEKEAKKSAYTHYKSFKKAHGMFHW